MGIDICGGMIVGRETEGIAMFNDLDCEIYEWVEENDLNYMSPYFDSAEKHWVVGYRVKDIPIKDIQEWVKEVEILAEKFKELTGEDAHLIGMQDVS